MVSGAGIETGLSKPSSSWPVPTLSPGTVRAIHNAAYKPAPHGGETGAFYAQGNVELFLGARVTIHVDEIGVVVGDRRAFPICIHPMHPPAFAVLIAKTDVLFKSECHLTFSRCAQSSQRQSDRSLLHMRRAGAMLGLFRPKTP
jgi:hypothetical protein